MAQVKVRYPNPDSKKAIMHPYIDSKLNPTLGHLDLPKLSFYNISQIIYSCDPTLKKFYQPSPQTRGGFQALWRGLGKGGAYTVQGQQEWAVFRAAYQRAWQPLKKEFPRLTFIAGGEAAGEWLNKASFLLSSLKTKIDKSCFSLRWWRTKLV